MVFHFFVFQSLPIFFSSNHQVLGRQKNNKNQNNNNEIGRFSNIVQFARLSFPLKPLDSDKTTSGLESRTSRHCSSHSKGFSEDRVRLSFPGRCPPLGRRCRWTSGRTSGKPDWKVAQRENLAPCPWMHLRPKFDLGSWAVHNTTYVMHYALLKALSKCHLKLCMLYAMFAYYTVISWYLVKLYMKEYRYCPFKARLSQF